MENNIYDNVRYARKNAGHISDTTDFAVECKKAPSLHL